MYSPANVRSIRGEFGENATFAKGKLRSSDFANGL